MLGDTTGGLVWGGLRSMFCQPPAARRARTCVTSALPWGWLSVGAAAP